MEALDYTDDILRLHDPTDIRLLQLHLLLDDGELSCSLAVFEQAAIPRYNCLSYTWGPHLSGETEDKSRTPSSRALLCNGRYVSIAHNLSTALIALARDQVAEEPAIFYWVDAISIDQANVAERNSQVGQMHRIFREAYATIAWLGPSLSNGTWPHEDWPSTLSFMRDFHHVDGPQGKYEIFQSVQGYHHGDPEAYKKLGIPFVKADQWYVLAQLMRCAWFSRVWCFQEMLISRRLKLLCGRHQVSVDELYDVNQFLSSSRWGSQMLPHSSVADTLLEPDLSAFYYRGWYQERGPLDARAVQACLGQLVRKHRYATDPRDFIYGLLGCADASVRALIVPDYSKSVRDVYTETARAMITLTGNLQLLGCVRSEGDTSIRGLPSWVPDFSLVPSPNSLHPLYKAEEFRAAGETTLIVHSTPSMDVLSLDGICFDSVAETFQPLSEFGDDFEDREQLDALRYMQVLLDILSRSEDIYHVPGESIVESFWRTTMANTALQVYPAPATWRAHFRNWLLLQLASMMPGGQAFELSRTMLDELAILRASGDVSDAELPTPQDVVAASRGFEFIPGQPYSWTEEADRDGQVSSSYLFTSNRRLKTWMRSLSLSAHGYLCMSTLETMTGDEIWILRGAGTPFVLRRGLDNKMRLIGEAYVHGIMNGEASAEEGVKWQRIELV
ncbi:hypothetical protein LTR15_010039 [Elasticomyces elasticus]|nr:hypothetical protein LTR15_010039 [Elasticomyces elasticus]